MHFKNSDCFEDAIFGRYSGDQGYVGYRPFDRSMRDIVRQDAGPAYPDTRRGKLLYFGVCRELERRGIRSEGLVLKSVRRSRLDIHHFMDGYFHLASIPDHLVTIDLFNLDSEVCGILKNRWEECGSESDFQTRLFQYKEGMVHFWRKGGTKVLYLNRIFSPFDFGSPDRRPENHLILTPYYTDENRQNRKIFSSLVADYFLKATKEASLQNMALLSH